MNFVNARKIEETRGWRLEERATGWQSQFSSRIYVHNMYVYQRADAY